MWDTDNTHKVNDTRTVVLGADGRTDITATLYAFGTDEQRLQAANGMLKAARVMRKSAAEIVNLIDSDVINTLIAEAKVLAAKAAWMAPDNALAEVEGHAQPYTVEGKDTEGWLILHNAQSGLNEWHAVDVIVWHAGV